MRFLLVAALVIGLFAAAFRPAVTWFYSRNGAGPPPATDGSE